MNKENKKMAQERRAREREKAERSARLGKLLLLIVVGVGIAAAGAAAMVHQGKSSSAVVQSEPETETSVQAEETKTTAAKAQELQTEGDGSYALFNAASLKGCYDISKDDLTYVQIAVKDYGVITAALDATEAPETVKNFLELAEAGFYDGLTFHRIMDGFMIQGGDPLGNGMGGSDQTIIGEFAQNGTKNLITHVRGAVSMARAQDPDSASSQFFIVQSDSTFLDGQYAGFGYVTDGMEIVDQICADAVPSDNNGTIAPDEQPVIESVTIVSE